jgi:hypothetical protein
MSCRAQITPRSSIASSRSVASGLRLVSYRCRPGDSEQPNTFRDPAHRLHPLQRTGSVGSSPRPQGLRCNRSRCAQGGTYSQSREVGAPRSWGSGTTPDRNVPSGSGRGQSVSIPRKRDDGFRVTRAPEIAGSDIRGTAMVGCGSAPGCSVGSRTSFFSPRVSPPSSYGGGPRHQSGYFGGPCSGPRPPDPDKMVIGLDMC